MALLLNKEPGLIDRSNAIEEIEFSEMDVAVLMSLLEESHCDVECDGCSEWAEMETVPSSPPSDDMNWCVEDHFEEISMDDFVRFGNAFSLDCHEFPLENGHASLWQETYDTTTYN
ncbi:hypothetical protein V6N13_117494 [Hibiscus sabdariffa]|uniref:Uncharacterized protein n=1 Tax=Hibiscus sabdariffa TaxID=183260 RepID=A0ABR2PB38_9ROSI